MAINWTFIVSDFLGSLTLEAACFSLLNFIPKNFEVVFFPFILS